MLERSKLAFTTACVAETDSKAERMIHWLADSCKRFNVPLAPYGMGKSYVDWTYIKITLFLPWARALMEEGFTHCFYTDGRDSFMLTGVDEVVEKYNQMGCPPYLISCEDQCYPFPELSEKVLNISKPVNPDNPWKYLGAGQYMGELKYMVGMWEALKLLYQNIPNENHDQGWLELGFAEGVLHPSEFKLDHGCNIFQTASLHRLGGDVPNYIELGRLEVKGGRVYNPITNSWPCAIHFPGGYSSPVSAKDHSLGPMWHALWGEEAAERERVRYWMGKVEEGLRVPLQVPLQEDK